MSNYNPGTGRFLSEDPIGFASGDFNLYRYVLNNPINSSDPTGESAIGGAAAVIVCGAAIIIVADKAAEIGASKTCQKEGVEKKACDEKAKKDGFVKNIGDILGI